MYKRHTSKFRKIAKMKAVRMTIVMATAFTICQVNNFKKFQNTSFKINLRFLKSFPPLIVDLLLSLGLFDIVVIQILYHWCMKPTNYSTKSVLKVKFAKN